MNALLQYAIYLGVLLLLVKPLGAYMANVYEGRYRFLAPLENLVYRSAGVRPEEEMDWKRYLWGVLWFNLIGFAAVYALQRLQHLAVGSYRKLREDAVRFHVLIALLDQGVPVIVELVGGGQAHAREGQRILGLLGQIEIVGPGYAENAGRINRRVTARARVGGLAREGARHVVDVTAAVVVVDHTAQSKRILDHWHV